MTGNDHHFLKIEINENKIVLRSEPLNMKAIYIFFTFIMGGYFIADLIMDYSETIHYIYLYFIIPPAIMLLIHLFLHFKRPPTEMIFTIEGVEIRDQRFFRLIETIARGNINYVQFSNFDKNIDGDLIYGLVIGLENLQGVFKEYSITKYYNNTLEGRSELLNHLIKFCVNIWKLAYDVIQK